MIPKKIHYCWFGRNPLPELAQKCIASWKKYCPDYEIVEWNEDNFAINACPLYVRQAYEHQKWAFVSDYARLKVVYEHGGIYMDTDVELIKSLKPLLVNSAYFGFEDGKYVATGLGFGAEKNHIVLSEMMADYQGISFVKEDGSFDTTPCPQRNTDVFLHHGLLQNNQMQTLGNDILILPSDYLCPMDYLSGKKKTTKNSISIHWFSESWKTEQEKQIIRNIRTHKKLSWKFYNYLISSPKRLGRKILGETNYERIKSILKR